MSPADMLVSTTLDNTTVAQIHNFSGTDIRVLLAMDNASIITGGSLARLIKVRRNGTFTPYSPKVKSNGSFVSATLKVKQGTFS